MCVFFFSITPTIKSTNSTTNRYIYENTSIESNFCCISDVYVLDVLSHVDFNWSILKKNKEHYRRRKKKLFYIII